MSLQYKKYEKRAIIFIVAEYIGIGFIVLDNIYPSQDQRISVIIAFALILVAASLTIYFALKHDKEKKVNK